MKRLLLTWKPCRLYCWHNMILALSCSRSRRPLPILLSRDVPGCWAFVSRINVNCGNIAVHVVVLKPIGKPWRQVQACGGLMDEFLPDVGYYTCILRIGKVYPALSFLHTATHSTVLVSSWFWESEPMVISYSYSGYSHIKSFTILYIWSKVTLP